MQTEADVSTVPPLPLGRYVATAVSARVVTEATAITLVLLGTDRGVSERSLGVLVACWTLPQIVTAPWVGARADRSRRPARLLAAMVLVGGMGIGAIGAGLGTVPIVALCAVSALISLAEPAIMGGLSGIATRSAHAASPFAQWDAASYGGAGIVAQALVSVTAAWLGSPTTVVIVVGLAVVAAVLMVQLPLVGSDARHEPTRTREVLALLFADRELRTMTVLSTLALSAFGGLALAAVDLAKHLGRDGNQGSRLVLALAIGSVVGSLVATRLPAPRHPLRTGALCVVVMAAAFGLSSIASWPIAIGLFVVAGFADAPMLIATFAVRTRRSDERMRASVYTIAASVKIAATSIGALAVGFVTGTASTGRGVLTLAAIELLALVAAGASLTLRRNRRAADPASV